MGKAGKYLVVNADDFGQSAAVNAGIIQAHQSGIVTSASLMVRWPGALDAVEYARKHASIGVGLHIDLGEWAYRDGQWTALYEVVPAGDAAAVRVEVYQQLDAFRRLTGRDPTHLDSHQHVHQREPVRQVVTELCEQLHLPVRHFAPEIRYCGEFYGQTTEGDRFPTAISVDALLALLSRLEPGVTEMACHPGIGEVPDTMYSAEREQEVSALCNPLVRKRLMELDITLVNFRDVAANVLVS